jgi:hypothetical protein
MDNIEHINKRFKHSSNLSTIMNSSPSNKSTDSTSDLHLYLSNQHEKQIKLPLYQGKTPFLNFYYLLTLQPHIGGEIIRRYARILPKVVYISLLYYFIRFMLHTLPYIDISSIALNSLNNSNSSSQSIISQKSTSNPKSKQPPNEDYSEQLLSKWFNVLMFGARYETIFQQIKDKNGRSGVCGASLNPGEPAYYCLTCSNDDPSCVICRNCFKNSNHDGHEIRIANSGGGLCDCGNIEAWSIHGCCIYHKGATSA